MTEAAAHHRKYLDAFEKHHSDVDKFAQVLLKGHLIIENALDNIIGLLFFHTEHLHTARLTFNQKTNIARAACLRKNTDSTWSLILAINSVRNEISHSLISDQRMKRIGKLRRLYFAHVSPELRKDEAKMGDEVMATYACASCVGFLAEFEHDTSALRAYIDGLDAVLNPDKERVKGPK